jgi:hypothetical protein
MAMPFTIRCIISPMLASSSVVVYQINSYRSEDAITAEYRAEVVVPENTYVDMPTSSHPTTALLLFGLLTGLAVWSTRRLQLRHSGRHKKEDDKC